MNKKKGYINLIDLIVCIVLSFLPLFVSGIIPVSKTGFAFAQGPCLFTNKLYIGIPESEPESEVILGMDMTSEKIPMPPPPPGFNVFMDITDPSDNIFPSRYKDIREAGNTTNKWLLNITVSEGVTDVYPVLTWSADAFCYSESFSLWLSNSNGELISQKIMDMTEVDSYTITSDGASYLLVVRSEATPPFQMKFLAGWKMISLPVIPVTPYVSDIFPDAEVVYGFERGTGYKRVNNLETGKGYWILFNEAKSYELQGQPFPEYTQTINADGWSMIGGCSTPAQATTDGCSIDVIYGYKQGIGYKRVLPSENIDPGQGYWLLLNGIEGECILSVKAVQ
jgi:hypothetical protein